MFCIIFSLLKWYTAQFLVFTIIYIYMLALTAKETGVFHPMIIFFGCSFLYFIAGSLDLIFFDDIYELSPEAISLQLNHALMFFLGFYILWVVFQEKVNKSIFLSVFDAQLSHDITRRVLTISLGVSIAILSILYCASLHYKFGGHMPQMSRPDMYSSMSFMEKFAKVFFPFFVITYIWTKAKYTHTSKIAFFGVTVFILAFIAADISYLGDRRTSVSLVLAILTIIFWKKRIGILSISLLSSLGIFLLFFYSHLRSANVKSWTNIISDRLTSDFNLGQTEFGAFSRISSDLMFPEFYFSKMSFLTSFLSAIPTFIFESKPLSSAVWYISEYHAELYEKGSTLAFNILVDSALSFGFLGPIFLAIMYFILFAPTLIDGRVAIYFAALFVYSLSFSARFGFTQLYMTVLSATVFVVLFGGYLIFLSVIKKLLSRKSVITAVN